MIRIFIGYDPRETVAYHVLCHSILSRSTRPILITPLALNHMKDVMWRERHNLQSTDFSFSRFLVPYLCNFNDWAIFMDCDMLVLDDIANLWDLRNDKFDVMCVKHNHTPKETKKFLGQPQTQYEKKNWSSVMLFNSQKCKVLTPKYVNEETGLNLHRFNWVGDDTLIGDLPPRWNHLVDYDPKVPKEQLSNLHFTTGGPYFEEFKNCGYSDLWFKERDKMLSTKK